MKCIDKRDFFSLLGCNRIVSQERSVPSTYDLFNVTSTVPSPIPWRTVCYNPCPGPTHCVPCCMTPTCEGPGGQALGQTPSPSDRYLHDRDKPRPFSVPQFLWL